MLIVLKYGCLNLLEPSGPVQACIRIALRLSLHTNIVIGDTPKVLLTENPKILFSDFLQPVLVTWHTYESVRLEHQQSVSGIEGCTHSVRWVSRATKYGEVMPNVRGSSVYRLLYVTHVAAKSMSLLLGHWKISTPLE